MNRILAFEGSGPGSSDVSWGAAAIQIGDKIFNSVTKFQVSRSEFERLINSGVLNSVPVTFENEERSAEYDCIVLRISRGSPPLDDWELLENLIINSYAYANDINSHFIVFESMQAFNKAVNLVIVSAMERIKELARNCLILDSSHTELRNLLNLGGLK